MSELLPCPFCHAEMRVKNSKLAAHPRFSECFISHMAIVVDDHDQVTKWNTRAIDDAKLREVINRLKLTADAGEGALIRVTSSYLNGVANKLLAAIGGA